MIPFIILFVLGRIVSLVIYRMCWSNGESGKFARQGAFFTLLRRPLPWLMHAAVMWPLAGLSWGDWPLLHGFCVMLAGLLALGAVGRFGSADHGRFFFADRLLVIALAAGVVFYPAFLYLCVVAACCLQYTVASWRLGPGYSNLLGYEFIRASLCVLITCFAVSGWLEFFGADWHVSESISLAVLLGYQASTYVNHALAKSALGPRWHSWIRENRLECLIANAWLRGWRFGRSRDAVMRHVRWIARRRVVICAVVWLLEIGWLVLLADPRSAFLIISATILLHLALFALTGLAAYQYIANHVFLLCLIAFHDTCPVFQPQYLTACLLVIPATALWIGFVRRRMLAEFRRSGAAGFAGNLADAADHLMAWWDTPLMRMFSHTVETRSGARFALPVPKLSPHDTALTDLHTHLMILGLHADLDPMIARDRKIARTGVWGLAIDRDDRDFLYQLMDASGSGFPVELQPEVVAQPWSLGPAGSSPASAVPLRDLFHGINRDLKKPWFRKILRWPHFPGEDLAPDICPLVEPAMKPFRFDESIASVTLWRIRTFHNHREMWLVEHEAVGRIHLEASNENP